MTKSTLSHQIHGFLTIPRQFIRIRRAMMYTAYHATRKNMYHS